MSNDQDPSNHVRLFGDDPRPIDGPSSSLGDLTVSKSGESILLTSRRPDGSMLPISAVRSSDDVQVLRVDGPAQGTSCTLTFAGATTAPIPLRPIPPLTAFVWKATLPRAGSYRIGLAYGNYGWQAGDHGCTAALVEVFDSGTLVGAASLDQSQFPDAAVDTLVEGWGVFRSVGAYRFEGTNLEVRISGVRGSGTLLAGMLRVAPDGSTDPSEAGYVDPHPYPAPGTAVVFEGSAGKFSYGEWTLSFYYTAAGSWRAIYFARPTGTEGTGFPTPADVEAALENLPGVLPGSLRVTSPTNNTMMIQFGGIMGGRVWPTMTCSEPAIAVLHDGTAGSAIGGVYPSVTINGVRHELKASSFAQGRPRMAFHLVQDAPAVQIQRYNEGLYRNFGYFGGRDDRGYGGRVGHATQGGPLANWRFQGIAGPAEFVVEVTWPGGDPAGDLLQCVVTDGDGTELATVSGIDQSRAPADVVDPDGTGWKTLGRFILPAQINALTVQARGPGNPDKHIILDTVRLRRVSPDRGIKIKTDDDVRFNLPPDFLSTISGPVPGIEGVPVASRPTTRLPAIPQQPKSLKLGYNCDFPVYYGNDSCFANMAIQASKPIGLAQDAAGNPTRLAADGGYGGGAAWSILTLPPSDASGRGFGVPTCGPGVWVVQWSGSPSNWCILESQAGGTYVSELTSRRTTVGGVSRRYFQVATTTPSSPGLKLRFISTNRNADGTYRCDVRDVAVYPPDVDPDATSIWRPTFLSKLRGTQCFRFMDMLGTNDLNLSEFSHFPDQKNFPLGYTGRTIEVPIDSIGPPEPDIFCENIGGSVVRIKTKVPHGLATGFLVSLRTTDGSSLGIVTGKIIDTRTGVTTDEFRSPLDPTDGYENRHLTNMCRVVDETTIQVGINYYNGPPARMTNTLRPTSGIVFAQVAPKVLMGPADIADLCVETGLEPWVNVPWLATDDCIEQMARVLGERLPRGRKIHVEFGNEPWNYAFAASSFASQMSRVMGEENYYIPFYITRMAYAHATFRAVWAELGRDPLEVRRVCGVHQENPGATSFASLAYALEHGFSFDELSPACYYSNTPAAGSADDLLTREQLLDLFAMNVQQSELPHLMGGHIKYFRDSYAHNPSLTWLRDVVLVNYEGGPDTMTTQTMAANLANRNHGVHRHPDFCEIQMHHLQMLEDAGVKLFNIFSLYGTRETAQWGVYEGYMMQPGTGDATVDVANVEDFENLPIVKSQVAAAFAKWGALQRQPEPPAVVPPRRQVAALSFGRLRSYGQIPAS